MQLSNVIPTSFFVIGGSTCLVVQGGGSEFESGRCILDGYFWFFLTRYPHPLGYGVCKGGLGCLWSLNRAFLWKLYKTKVARHPQIKWGKSTFWTPNLDPEGPGPHGHSLWRIAYKIKILWCVPNSFLGWSPSTLPRSRERKSGPRFGSGASAVHFGKNFIKQKLLGTPN